MQRPLSVLSLTLVGLCLAPWPLPLQAQTNGHEPAGPRWVVCFTPPEDCTGAIVAALDAAQERILVQAYSFTSAPIAKALVDGQTVITGSFNFTKAAEDSNAENLLVIRDQALADRYVEHWQAHGIACESLHEPYDRTPAARGRRR